jgi:prepilin-type N-terminal cleavage/methylation domain-containing protein
MKGFTLPEVITTIVIFTLIMGALSSLVVLGYQIYGHAWEQTIAVDEARKGIDTMTQEIREARPGEDGSYPLERADDKQIIFYSDIDGDNKTERVRYFLGMVSAGSLAQECQTASAGGSCSVTFSNFFTGDLKSAQIKIMVEGDLDAANEYVTISANGTNMGDLCRTNCFHCAGTWQGTTVTDITNQAMGNSIQFLAVASSRVGRECPVGAPNHSMKARFELTWTEEIIGAGNELRKGIVKATSSPAQYPLDQEKISILTSYVRNAPPIFEYFDANGDKITSVPTRLVDTKMIKTFLVVNVNPNRPPKEFELETSVQMRNLKTE